MLKDYDKANVVVDTLSRMTMGSIYHIHGAKKDQGKDAHRFSRLEDSSISSFMVHNNSESSLLVEVM